MKPNSKVNTKITSNVLRRVKSNSTNRLLSSNIQITKNQSKSRNKKSNDTNKPRSNSFKRFDLKITSRKSK